MGCSRIRHDGAAATRAARCAVLLLAVVVPRASPAQDVLGRTTLTSDGIGLPWSLRVEPSLRYTGPAEEGVGLRATPMLAAALGLPGRLLAGARYAAHSPLVPERPDEWEAYARLLPLMEERGAPFDLAISAGYNGAARSLDGELAAARWLGAFVRAHIGVRAFSNVLDSGESEAAVVAGAALFPLPARAPISLAAAVASPLNGVEPDGLVWSAALNLGLTHTTHTLSAFVTNSASGTLQGRSRRTDDVRVGVSFTAPIPLGRLFGLVASREQGRRAVEAEAEPSPDAVPASIFRNAYVETRIEITRGTTIEWLNSDRAVHTVTADDASWNSGAIQPGERWRASFHEPGLYTFHCGPHPFMKGVVIVR